MKSSIILFKLQIDNDNNYKCSYNNIYCIHDLIQIFQFMLSSKLYSFRDNF